MHITLLSTKELHLEKLMTPSLNKPVQEQPIPYFTYLGCTKTKELKFNQLLRIELTEENYQRLLDWAWVLHNRPLYTSEAVLICLQLAMMASNLYNNTKLDAQYSDINDLLENMLLLPETPEDDEKSNELVQSLIRDIHTKTNLLRGFLVDYTKNVEKLW